MSNVGKTFEEAGKAFFDQDAKPVLRVYADLEYLQDLRLGALLYGCTVDAEMKYIHSCLDRYNNRYDLHTAKYFGALKKTDEDLDNLLKTPIVRDRICFLAPWTSTYYRMMEILDMYNSHNKQMLDNPQKIHLTINVSDVQYPIELKQFLEQSLGHQLNLDVEVQQLQRYTADAAEYLEYQMLFIYDYGRFVNTFPNAFVGEGKFSDTRIIAQPYIEEGLGHQPEDYEDILASTEKGMDIYCDFVFLRSDILLDKTEKSKVNG